ncbi:PLDc N-terminal domain-containing protein, partial [Streptococcus salivarius]
MTQEQSARLLPQKPSRWAKILLNRKVPILLFFLLELAFLVFSYLSLQEHFPSIILWEHLLSVFTFFYLLNRSMDSRSKLSWVIIIALFPI